MRYRIAAIGQLRRGFLADGCDFYLARLARYAKVDALDLKEGRGDPDAVRAQEGEALLAAAGPRAYLVALDEGGAAYGSSALAREISRLEVSGVSLLAVLIGGAEGHGDALRARADAAWSLSKLTLPHELARMVLLEQLYRAETIRAGHPYHRG